MARPWGCAPDGKMLGSGSASPPALDRGAPAILQPSTFESTPPPPAPAGSTARGPPPGAYIPTVHDGKFAGVVFIGAGTKGRMENCDVFDNEKGGVAVSGGAAPLVVACK